MDESLLEELERLRKENAALKEQLYHKPTPTAQEKIRLAVSSRILELMPNESKYTKQTYKRRLTEDLKWHLRVRYVSQFSDAHLEEALAFIKEWVPDDYHIIATGTDGPAK